MDLTEHQREVFEQLVEWYNDTDSDRPFLCLKGAAGTGKSFLAAYFSAFASVGGNVMVTATTNSAVKVIQEKCRKVNRFSGRSIEGMTIYRLLNLKVENDEDRIIIQQKKSYSEEKLYNLVVVDESSMVGDDIFDKIISSRRSLKWLFVGDHCQLIPVGSDISPCFTLPTLVLKEVVRQAASNPVMPLITTIRTHIEQDIEEIPDLENRFSEDKSSGIWNYPLAGRQAWYKKAVECFKSEASENLGFARVITLKNSTERVINQQIRELVTGNKQPFAIGEKIVLKSSYFRLESLVLPTGSEFTISECDETVIDPSDYGKYLLKDSIPGFILTGYDEEGKRKQMTTIAPESEGILEDWEIKSKARIGDLMGWERKKAWKSWHVFRNGIADVTYRYAATVRRMQGFDVENAFTVTADLCSPGIPMKSRLRNLYVAVTRSTQRVINLV